MVIPDGFQSSSHWQDLKAIFRVLFLLILDACLLQLAESNGFKQTCAGLLLADRLLFAGCSVHLVESRADPRAGSLEGRAYALGLGIRAQRAIRR